MSILHCGALVRSDGGGAVEASGGTVGLLKKLRVLLLSRRARNGGSLALPRSVNVGGPLHRVRAYCGRLCQALRALTVPLDLVMAAQHN